MFKNSPPYVSHVISFCLGLTLVAALLAPLAQAREKGMGNLRADTTAPFSLRSSASAGTFY